MACMLRLARFASRSFGMVSALGLALALTLSVAAQEQKPPAEAAQELKKPGNPRVRMTIANRGEIVLELFPQDAPRTVAHILDLVERKFYDGIKFHRVVPRFVAQAGDPVSKEADPDEFETKQVGTHGSGRKVPLEVKRSHKRGTLGLARAPDPNSGDSQFFLNLVDNDGLDQMTPGYCVFGAVVKGLNVMDSIRQGDRIETVRVVAAELTKARPSEKKDHPHVTMTVQNRGDIVIELLPEDAPKTVAHFLDLVDKKFYDGILFHRYVRFFVAQAGDPKSKEVQGEEIANLPWEEAAEKFKLGDGGSGKTVPLEVRRKHEWGTLGMARDNNPDSGDSQFFFNLTDNTRLDQRMPGYCVFGRVVRGLDVMDSIRQGDKIVSIRRTEAKDKDQ